jgi:tetratricopeptide (TPR) repeat protein
MAEVIDLIDRGIKAYVAGRVGEALRTFQEVLERDPANARARSYLLLIHGAGPGFVAPAPSGAHVPLPGPAAPPLPGSAAGAAPPAGAAAAAPQASAAPVRLPAPTSRPAVVVPAPAVSAPDEQDNYAPSPWDEGPAAAATFVLEPGGGLDLQAVAEKSDLRPLVPEGATTPLRAPPAMKDVDVWMHAGKELFALGDFTGSLELIEKILQVDPDHGEARDYLRQNEATLIAMYESKLGPLGGVPRLAIKPEEIMWLNLDHRAGFLLAQIDGTVDYEALFALSGLPRLDTARILANLIADGVIA